MTKSRVIGPPHTSTEFPRLDRGIYIGAGLTYYKDVRHVERRETSPDM
ncbi:hypothetical protein BN59_01651 [Legionella massiliensis]|uniref:Uncharacterized protein n=1 Tax=Legionella massiliensis TaxID=1034943 RepID=A0A078KZZ0_9GAMM|nr:hypothetical protein BN59_01651 [Legionella massiliensis]CEE13106.1 hypothetical protein BN1094_01651 [Legionella massiliensis]